jgi:dihydrofolate reductase
MRKVILLMSISIDGVVAAPNDPQGLTPAREDPELKALKLEWLSHAGCHIMGRTTYEQMAGHWPYSDDAYAQPMNALPKVVFSRSLTEAPWETSRIAGGDLAEEIAGLKREPGGDIIAWGGASFAHSLIAANLIDEYRLVVHPVLVGDGLRIFDRFPGPIDVSLSRIETFGTGSAVHVYDQPHPRVVD